MNELDARGLPTEWVVFFHLSTGRRWLDRLIPGRFKHVSIGCWIEDPGVWLFYDVGFTGSVVKALPAKAGDIWAARQMQCGCALKVASLGQPVGPPLFGWCVPAVRRLIGLRARCVAPDGLFRELRRTNAEIIHDVQFFQPARGAALD